MAILTLGRCTPGTIPAGVARFKNVGNNDFNEGARNFIAIRVCIFRPGVPIRLTAGRCRARAINRVRFQNVARNDFNEGAPNFVTIRLYASVGGSVVPPGGGVRLAACPRNLKGRFLPAGY